MRKLRTVIIIIGIVLVFVVCGTYYKETYKIVSPEVTYLNPDNMDNIMKNWVEKQGNSSNMLLGKMIYPDKVEEYYLYINNIKMTDVYIKPHGYDGIRIQVNISDNTNKTSTVFRIKPTDKKLKYIIINDNKLEVSSIVKIN